MDTSNATRAAAARTDAPAQDEPTHGDSFKRGSGETRSAATSSAEPPHKVNSRLIFPL